MERFGGGTEEKPKIMLPLSMIRQTNKRVQDDILNFTKPVVITAPTTGSIDRKRYYDKNSFNIKQQFQTFEGQMQAIDA